MSISERDFSGFCIPCVSDAGVPQVQSVPVPIRIYVKQQQLSRYEMDTQLTNSKGYETSKPPRVWGGEISVADWKDSALSNERESLRACGPDE